MLTICTIAIGAMLTAEVIKQHQQMSLSVARLAAMGDLCLQPLLCLRLCLALFVRATLLLFIAVACVGKGIAAPEFSAAYQSSQDFRQWQQHALQLLQQSLLQDELAVTAVLQEAQAQPFSSQLQSQFQLQYQLPLKPGYLRQQWRFRLQNQQYQTELTADLLLPEATSGKAVTNNKPAVLLLHDHGAEFRLGRHKYLPAAFFQEPALVTHWQQRYFSGVALAELLVGAGFVVLVADAPGFGERDALRYDEQQRLAARLLAKGLSLAGVMAREDQALARWLAKQTGQGVMAVGFSMGGFRALQQAALTAEVTGAVSIGWFNSLRFLRADQNNFSKGQSSFYLIHPGLNQALDLPDQWLLAAPKPLLILMGAKDPLMPPAEVAQAFQTLSLGYHFATEQNAVGDKLTNSEPRSTAAWCHRPALATDAASGHDAGHWYQQRLLGFLQNYSLLCSNKSN